MSLVETPRPPAGFRAATTVRWVLALSAAGFLAAGTLFSVWPTELAGFVDITAESVTARGDVRAVFGGLELGVGVCLLLSALRPEWWRAGLVLQLLGYGGLAGGRLASLVLDGPPAPIAWSLLAAELAALGLGLLAWRRLAARPPAGAGA